MKQAELISMVENVDGWRLVDVKLDADGTVISAKCDGPNEAVPAGILDDIYITPSGRFILTVMKEKSGLRTRWYGTPPTRSGPVTIRMATRRSRHSARRLGQLRGMRQIGRRQLGASWSTRARTKTGATSKLGMVVAHFASTSRTRKTNNNDLPLRMRGTSHKRSSAMKQNANGQKGFTAALMVISMLMGAGLGTYVLTRWRTISRHHHQVHQP